MLEDKARERRTPASSRSADARDDYERDRSRLIHSPSFRRLQAKTQVLGPAEGDYHRTRLTHSMEAAQIARGIVLTLRRNHPEAGPHLPSLELIEAICLAHDLGHPPFGHGGERALNYRMRHHGGFEGNGQTLRILADLDKHTEGYGLNLTRRAMLGVLKYPAPYPVVVRLRPEDLFDQRLLGVQAAKPPKCYLETEHEVVTWILAPFPPEDRKEFLRIEEREDSHAKTVYKALDTSIMEVADDVAYGIHDLEDMLALKLLERKQDQLLVLMQHAEALNMLDRSAHAAVEELYGRTPQRRDLVGMLVNRLINRTRIISREQFQDPLLRYVAQLDGDTQTWLDSIKDFVFKSVVSSPEVLSIEYGGQQTILDLFAAFLSAPKEMLPEDYRGRIGQHGAERAICDYIAGMTDVFATRFHQRLFSPGARTVFERL
jgi:dGTPase